MKLKHWYNTEKSLNIIRFNASACQASGPRFESSISSESPDFVPVAPQVAFSGMRQARIVNNLFIYLFINDQVASRTELRFLVAEGKYFW